VYACGSSSLPFGTISWFNNVIKPATLTGERFFFLPFFRQPDRWREQPEADVGGGHDDALDRLIKAQNEALKGAAGRP
jgi:hypothetical protein